jgi:hypothetical protein
MLTGVKSIFLYSSLFLVVAWVSSCGTKQKGCEKRIAEQIHIGVPAAAADAVLKECGFKTSLDVAKNTLYGDKRVGSLIVERTQVLVSLDPDKKVARVSVTKGLVGP